MNKYFKTQDQFDLLDIYDLFKYYNDFFFNGVLEKSTVSWSEKMTLCAGTCTHKGHQSCDIKLSAPLLKFRSANELKETLLHEMIHGYLFITNPTACLTEGGHGKQFKQIMNNINQITKLNITIYHNFKDQVDLYRKHIWRCNGLCQEKPPFYGYVKRAVNRRPQIADPWFNDHKRTCGGQFIKISGDDPDQKKSKPKKSSKPIKHNWGKGKTIQQYFIQMNESKEKKRNSHE